MDKYKSLEKDPEKTTEYFHFYILPYFDMLRQQNKLKYGKKKITIDGKKWYYHGEMDENGDCVGVGTATNKYGDKITYYGTWLNDK